MKNSAAVNVVIRLSLEGVKTMRTRDILLKQLQTKLNIDKKYFTGTFLFVNRKRKR